MTAATATTANTGSIVVVVITTRRAFPYNLPFMTHQFLLGNLYVGMEQAASVVIVTIGLLEVVFSFVVVVNVVVIAGIVFVLRGRFGSARGGGVDGGIGRVMLMLLLFIVVFTGFGAAFRHGFRIVWVSDDLANTGFCCDFVNECTE